MAQIEITKNEYNTTCDTYGCSNIAKYVIGKVGEGQAQKTLYCEECLQNIINAVPLEMILNRPELGEDDERTITIDEEGNEPGTSNCGRQEGDPEEVGKAQEVEVSDLNLMKFNELKELAAERGITVPFGSTKEALIILLKEEVNNILEDK